MPTSPDSPRVFLASAPQDLKFIELLTAKALADRLPLVFETMGEGRTDEIGFQLECRRRIRAARVLVVVVSPHTSESKRVKWQVECARELGLQVVGITVGFESETGAAPAKDAIGSGEAIVGWKWKSIAATLMRFASGPAPRRPAEAGAESVRASSDRSRHTGSAA